MSCEIVISTDERVRLFELSSKIADDISREKVQKILTLLSEDLSHDNISEAKKILKNIVEQSTAL